MADMTPKENFMAVINGQIPQSVPYYNLGKAFPDGSEATRTVAPDLFHDHSRGPKGGVDIWGVTFVSNAETGFATIPEPGNFILDDITKWRDVIKAPEVPDVDWEAMSKADFARANIDRSQKAIFVKGDFQPFQRLVAFMGFSEALCALYEEPEEVKALLNWMADFYVPIIEKTLDYYKPDFFTISDDTASKYNPFFSLEMYQDIFRPIYDKLAKPMNDRGIPIAFHNCGRCEDFLDEMIDFGTKLWEPAQIDNDLDGIKKKYQGKLAMAGCWETVLFPDWPNTPREEIVESIHKTIDRFAPNGGYMFKAGVLQQAGDAFGAELQLFIRNEALKYMDHYYDR